MQLKIGESPTMMVWSALTNAISVALSCRNKFQNATCHGGKGPMSPGPVENQQSGGLASASRRGATLAKQIVDGRKAALVEMSAPPPGCEIETKAFCRKIRSIDPWNQTAGKMAHQNHSLTILFTCWVILLNRSNAKRSSAPKQWYEYVEYLNKKTHHHKTLSVSGRFVLTSDLDKVCACVQKNIPTCR